MLIKKQPGRRWLKYIAALGLLVATLVIAGIALAVHDLTFQLDGNTKVDAATHIGTGTQSNDWETFFDGSGTGGTMKKIPGVLSTTGLGYTADAFSVDFNTKAARKGGVAFDTSDNSTYATGSKDTLDINPGWQCSAANNLLSKNDIMNAYTVAYTNPIADANQFLADGHTPNPNFGKHHQILYFALERNNNNGDANVGFWFLQGPASCDTQNGTVTGAWQGHHTDGDVLIVSAFTNGGGVSGITAYKWSSALGTVDPNPVGNGGDCQGASGLDAICATTNGSASPGLNAAITTAWLTAAGTSVGNTLQPSEFFEGGIDLTTEGLGDKCFNTFVGDTRSSQSLTATIFDYALGTLGECTSSTVTTPKESDGTTTITSDPIPATGPLDVKDTALVTVNPATTVFSGSISFSLCGPFAADSTTTCDTGGVAVSSQNITTGGTYTSGVAHITSAGRYCWRGDFSGDSSVGVPGSSDHSATECFLVTPLTPTLSTAAGAGPVDLGNPVTDTATLSGTANEPGSAGPTGSNGTIDPTVAGGPAQGTITFTLYKADCSTLATGVGTNPQTVNVTGPGGDGTYGPVSFTPDTAGTFHWVASYSGDLPNTLDVTHNATCNDTAEDVVVNQVQTTISTRQFVFPQDKATVVAPGGVGGNLTGTLSFKLYDSSADCTANTTTGLLYSPTGTAISGASPQSATTNNTTVRILTSTTVYWRVTYVSTNPAQLGSSSVCTESTAVTYSGNDGTISIP
jgi:hypothetical protein